MAEEGLNRVTLIGRLGQDGELRFTQGGQPILNLRLATAESFLNSNKERQERTEWHSVTLWGKRGESLSKYLTKGSKICVEGRLQTRSWEGKDGSKRYSTEVVATNILLLGGGKGGSRSNDDDTGGYGGGGYSGRPSEQSHDGGDDFNDDEIPF
jgi:single-strand DNA-binding protein